MPPKPFFLSSSARSYLISKLVSLDTPSHESRPDEADRQGEYTRSAHGGVCEYRNEAGLATGEGGGSGKPGVRGGDYGIW